MKGKQGVKKPSKYNGDLDKPIVWPSMLLGAKGTSYPKVVAQHIVSEKHRKLTLLLKHYKILPHDLALFDLAFALADDHVPGFEVLREQPASRGRKSRWSGIDGIEVYVRVQDELGKAGGGLMAACEKIQIDGYFTDISLESLRNGYDKFLKSKLHKAMFQDFKAPKDILMQAWLDTFNQR